MHALHRIPPLVALALGASLASSVPAQPTLGDGPRPSASDVADTDAQWLESVLRAGDVGAFREAVADAALRAGEAQPFNEADMFFEENATAGDLGIHFAIDHSSEDAWRRVVILFPDGATFMNVRAGGAEAENGVTGLFSESAEPSYDDVPRDEFLAMFPEGEYTFVGWTTNGNMLMSTDTLTHNLPAPPVALSPSEGAVVDYDRPLLIRWQFTPDPSPPESRIVAYQVIVSKEEPGEPVRVMEIEMLPTQRSVRVPREFFEPGKTYKYEILARETGHNQVITEVEFSTEEEDDD